MSENTKMSSSASWQQYLLEITKVVVISLVIVLPVRTFLMTPYYVQQESMMPNFQPNNYLIVNRWSLRSNELDRGDVTVFKVPDEKDALIKRVIGLPGETIEVKERSVFINGEEIDESSYLAEDIETWGNVNLSLGEDEYFMMGDNRNHSLDSRHFGAINIEQMVGRASVRLLPVSQIERFDAVSYPNGL